MLHSLMMLVRLVSMNITLLAKKGGVGKSTVSLLLFEAFRQAGKTVAILDWNAQGTSSKALEQIGGFNTAIAFYGEDTDIARRMNTVGMVRFTFDLKMYSSAQRLKQEGMLTIAARYTINYLWTTFRKKPFTQEYVDIREQAAAKQKI